MCMLISRKDKSYWRELDDDLAYYLNDPNSKYIKSHLRIQNIQTDQNMEYLNIIPGTMGLLNKQKFSLSVFIETAKQTIIGRLDKSSLNLKIKYQICYHYLFTQDPIYDFNSNIFMIFQNGKLIQINANKLIRKYKGKCELILSSRAITNMGLGSYNIIKFRDYFFNQFQILFENQFKIPLLDIDQKYEINYVFKKLGDFLILKKHNKLRIKTEQLSVYYLFIDGINSQDCMKGKICLREKENLKMIKCYNKHLYVVLAQDFYIKVFQIISEYEREFIYSVFRSSSVKKPILRQNHILYTNKSNSYILDKLQIDLKRNEKKII